MTTPPEQFDHTFSIARMTAQDVDDVYPLEKLCFSAPWSREAYYQEMANWAAYYLVARLDGRLVGFGGMWVIEEEAHIVTLATHPAWRRRGIGRRLLEGLLAEARRRGAREVSLEVRVGNEAARSLYASFGFRVIAFRPRYYPDNNEDAAVMRVELAEA